MSDSPQPTARGAVFLSYAREDTEAARRIAEALRSHEVEVWFDQNDLRGGDAWDAEIRRQIKECTLFLPVISAATQARLEGYFRIEWKLAAQRTHAMAEAKTFLLPVVTDGTHDAEAHVPEEFRAVQWTRLPGGETPPAFVHRVQSVLTAGGLPPPATTAPLSPRSSTMSPINQRQLAAVVFTDVVGYSERMQRAETATMALVAADFASMRARCEEHGGELLNSMGDGLLLCFPSAVQAVTCALQIQAEFGQRHATMPAEQALEHRMGVHIGDVFRQEAGGVAGDGVNIAARLEGKAPPGGVCVSQMVYDTVQGKVPMRAVFIGPEMFKNIANPIPIWHIAPEGGSAPLGPPMKAATRLQRMRLAGAVIVSVLVFAAAAGIYWPHRPRLTSGAPRPAASDAATVTAPAPVPVQATNSEARQLVQRARVLLEQYVVDDTLRESLTLAEELSKKALQLDVTDAEAWALSSLVAGSYIVTARDRSPARHAALNAAAEKAIKLAPDSDEAQFARAAAFRLTVSMRPEAERMLRELVQRVPADTRYLRMLGNVLRNRNANEEALAIFDRAAALPSGDARAVLSRAELLLKLGRMDEAVAATDRSLAVQQTGAAYLFKVKLARARGDLTKARAELAKMPPAVLLDQRGAAMAANLWLWSHEPAKAIAVLAAVPDDDFSNTFYSGPKSALIGYAHQQAGQEEAARAQWRSALKSLERQQAADPMIAVDPFFIAQKTILGCLVGDPDKWAEASQMLRLYLQLGGMGEIPAEWEPVQLFTLIGRQDIIIDLGALVLKSGDMPNMREEMRRNPLYAPLRGNPRFEALLVEPK